MKDGYSIKILSPVRKYYVLGILPDSIHEGMKNPKAAEKKEAIIYMTGLIMKLRGTQNV